MNHTIDFKRAGIFLQPSDDLDAVVAAAESVNEAKLYSLQVNRL